VARVKKQVHERLEDANIERVIELLAANGTKKAACEMLNISYNTKRLSRIIDEFNSTKDYEIKRRKQLRGKSFDPSEIRYTVLNYLKGDSISSLAKSQFRTTSGIKGVLKRFSIPERDASTNYWRPTIIPDDAISGTFQEEELVWSARYNCVAIVQKLYKKDKTHGNIYSIWVFGKHNEGALQPAYELGKLDILKELGVTCDDFEEYKTEGLFYSHR